MMIINTLKLINNKLLLIGILFGLRMRKVKIRI